MKHLIQPALTTRKILAVSIGIALQTAAFSASAAGKTQPSEVAALKAQLEILQKRFDQLEQQQTAKSGTSQGVLVAEHVGILPHLQGEQSEPLSTDESAVAESAPVVATSDDLDGIKADLENYKYDQSRQYERQTVKSTRDATLYGTVQVRANAQDAQGVKSTFDIGTALLGVRGNLFRDYNEGKNLEYQLSFNYGKQNNGTNNSNFNLQDAFLRYNVFSTNSGAEEAKLNVTLGQQLIPFGLEAQSPEDLRPTISTAAAPTNLGLFTRQNGVIVRGDYKPFVDYAANYRAPLLEYAFGVTNGNGSNKSDDNNSKDYLGRVAFTLPVDYASLFRELKFGASIIKGEAKLTGDEKARKDRFGLDLYYNHAPFGVTYEYIQGKTDYVSGAQIAEAKAEGHTFTAFYTLGDQFYNSIKSNAKFDDFWPKSIQGYYRYDTYNPNSKQKDFVDSNNRIGEYDIHSLGLNFFFAQTTKFQLQLNHLNYDLETDKQQDTNELQAQFQYTF